MYSEHISSDWRSLQYFVLFTGAPVVRETLETLENQEHGEPQLWGTPAEVPSLLQRIPENEARGAESQEEDQEKCGGVRRELAVITDQELCQKDAKHKQSLVNSVT